MSHSKAAHYDVESRFGSAPAELRDHRNSASNILIARDRKAALEEAAAAQVAARLVTGSRDGQIFIYNPVSWIIEHALSDSDRVACLAFVGTKVHS